MELESAVITRPLTASHPYLQAVINYAQASLETEGAPFIRALQQAWKICPGLKNTIFLAIFFLREKKSAAKVNLKRHPQEQHRIQEQPFSFVSRATAASTEEKQPCEETAMTTLEKVLRRRRVCNFRVHVPMLWSNTAMGLHLSWEYNVTVKQKSTNVI